MKSNSLILIICLTVLIVSPICFGQLLGSPSDFLDNCLAKATTEVARHNCLVCLSTNEKQILEITYNENVPFFLGACSELWQHDVPVKSEYYKQLLNFLFAIIIFNNWTKYEIKF